MTPDHEPGDEPRCDRCGQRLDPSPKKVWNGFLVQVAYDAWGILLFLAGISTLVFLVTGGFRAAYLGWVLTAFLALILVDVMYLFNHIMVRGWPTRSIKRRL